MKRTQEQINEWERENKDRIIKWEKDYVKNSITFTMTDKTEVKFIIIP